jgi:hypothetical protein
MALGVLSFLTGDLRATVVIFPEFDLKSTHYSLVKAFKAWISL